MDTPPHTTSKYCAEPNASGVVPNEPAGPGRRGSQWCSSKISRSCPEALLPTDKAGCSWCPAAGLLGAVFIPPHNCCAAWPGGGQWAVWATTPSTGPHLTPTQATSEFPSGKRLRAGTLVPEVPSLSGGVSPHPMEQRPAGPRGALCSEAVGRTHNPIAPG